jgi:PEP-CTERM motif
MSKSIWTMVALASAAVVTSSAASADTALSVSVGSNPSGPSLIITANSDGSFTTTAGPSSGPYDNVEDTYFGVVNNTGAPLTSLFLTAAAGTNEFGFDGDGIVTFTAALAATGTNTDTTGYGGPDASFIALNFDNGTVVFNNGGISANGGTDVFSLEEAISLNTLVISNGVPEPSTWAMMILGFLGLGFLARRKIASPKQQLLAA